ncbi:hypothetical protein [Rhodoferax fermentans]|nr:hypothetical protein [Rhodoferax fermentans]
MTAINAALEAEKQKATAASLLQRAATLAELGFGDKVETTAAAAGKLLDNANLKIDALLNDAIPAAQKRIDQANTALVQADKATRAAEAEILKAHADCAELALAVAAEDFEKLVLSFHASRIAAFGDFGRRVEHYTVVNDTRFEIEAERIRAQAEQGN